MIQSLRLLSCHVFTEKVWQTFSFGFYARNSLASWILPSLQILSRS